MACVCGKVSPSHAAQRVRYADKKTMTETRSRTDLQIAWIRNMIVALLTVVILWTRAAGAEPWACPQRTVEPCFKGHGRVSSQNGIPLTIWLIGTTRRLSVVNDSSLPATITKYLEMTSADHSYVYGDFEICPIEPDTSGRLRQTCLVGAEKIVIENLAGSRPPFRLLSTWPVGAGK